jgi:hypothetical protein
MFWKVKAGSGAAARSGPEKVRAIVPCARDTLDRNRIGSDEE